MILQENIIPSYPPQTPGHSEIPLEMIKAADLKEKVTCYLLASTLRHAEGNAMLLSLPDSLPLQ